MSDRIICDWHFIISNPEIDERMCDPISKKLSLHAKHCPKFKKSFTDEATIDWISKNNKNPYTNVKYEEGIEVIPDELLYRLIHKFCTIKYKAIRSKALKLLLEARDTSYKKPLLIIKATKLWEQIYSINQARNKIPFFDASNLVKCYYNYPRKNSSDPGKGREHRILLHKTYDLALEQDVENVYKISLAESLGKLYFAFNEFEKALKYLIPLKKWLQYQVDSKEKLPPRWNYKPAVKLAEVNDMLKKINKKLG